MKVTLEPTQDELEDLRVTFPGGAMPSAEEFLNGTIEMMFRHIRYVSALRRDAAISGAMRWHESQEFYINDYDPPRGA